MCNEAFVKASNAPKGSSSKSTSGSIANARAIATRCFFEHGYLSIPDDHKNVAKAFEFSKWKYLTKVLLPFSLPHIITGLRLSIAVA